MTETEIDTTETEDTPIRRVRGTALKSYLWERVPRQLLDDARAKCKRQDPPVFLKFKLIELLREWTYAPEPEPAGTTDHRLRWSPAQFGKTAAHCSCGADCPATAPETIREWFADHLSAQVPE